MDKPALIVWLRHAESLRNKVKKDNIYLPENDTALLVKGMPDHQVPITSFGKKQCLITGVDLRKEFGLFDVVYDSGYLRTRETREGVMSAYHPEERQQIKFRESYLLRERDAGYTHDMTTEEVNRHFPFFPEHWAKEGPFYARPVGGESKSDLCQRVYIFNGMMFRHRAGQKVLIFSHGGTIMANRFNLEGWNADEFVRRSKEEAPGNCSITVYEYSPKSNKLELVVANKMYWDEKLIAPA